MFVTQVTSKSPEIYRFTYVAMISQEGELDILTTKQYLQISQRVDECIKFAQDWIKNDTKRMKSYLQLSNQEK